MSILLTKLRNVSYPRINALYLKVKMEWIKLWCYREKYSFKIISPNQNQFSIELYKNLNMISNLNFYYSENLGVFVINIKIFQLLIQEEINEVELSENLNEILEIFMIESFK